MILALTINEFESDFVWVQISDGESVPSFLLLFLTISEPKWFLDVYFVLAVWVVLFRVFP